MENNRNYLDEKRNRITMLIVIGILSAAAILMLYSVPGVLRSNAPIVLGGRGE
jgi:multisubunit Na+/H+ antiporter MnhC subunit